MSAENAYDQITRSVLVAEWRGLTGRKRRRFIRRYRSLAAALDGLTGEGQDDSLTREVMNIPDVMLFPDALDTAPPQTLRDVVNGSAVLFGTEEGEPGIVTTREEYETGLARLRRVFDDR